MKTFRKALFFLTLAVMLLGLILLGQAQTHIQAADDRSRFLQQGTETPTTTAAVSTPTPTPNYSYLPIIIVPSHTPTITPYPTPVYPVDVVPIGPVGLTFTSVLVDPVHPEIIYAGSYGRGVFKSVDRGQTWYIPNTGMPPELYVESLGVINKSPNVIFAGTSRGLYRSINYGETWTKVGEAFGTNSVYAVINDPKHPNIVYAVTRLNEGECSPYRGALYRSTDWGINWQFMRYGDVAGTCADYWYDLEIDPWNSSHLYLPYHEHGVYQSHDFGSSFVETNAGISWVEKNDKAVISARAIAIDSLTGRSFAGLWEYPSLYYSDNMGASWAKASFGSSGIRRITLSPFDASRQRVILSTAENGVVYSDNSGASWIFRGINDPDSIVYEVAVSPGETQVWFAGVHMGPNRPGLYISSNLGRTWYTPSISAVNTSVVALTESPLLPGKTIAAVYGQGVLVTTDGADWEVLNTGLDSTLVTDLYSEGGQLFALADTGIYKFDGSTWRALPLPSVGAPDLAAYAKISSEGMLIETMLVEQKLESRLQRSSALQSGDGASGNLPLTKLAGKSGRLYGASAGNGLWADEAGKWQQVAFDGQQVADLVFSADGSLGLAAVCKALEDCSVYRQVGEAWLEVSDGLPAGRINTLLLNTTKSAYAATDSGLYRFDPSRETWEDTLLPGKPIHALNYHPSQNLLLALGQGAAWYSRDGGSNWQALQGLSNELDYISAMVAADGKLVIGSATGGAFRLTLP